MDRGSRSPSARRTVIAVLFVTIIAVVAMLSLTGKRETLSFPVGGNITFHVVEVDDRTRFRPTRFVVSTAYRLMPEWKRKLLGINRPRGGRGSGGRRRWNSFSYTMEASIPPEWRKEASREEIIERISDAMASAGAQSLQLLYGNGYYSSRATIIPVESEDERFLYRVSFSAVPLTAETFDILLMAEDSSATSFPLIIQNVKNPVYRKVAPLVAEGKLPLTKKSGDVTVTLVNLVSKVELPGSENDDAVDTEAPAGVMQFTRASGTLKSPYNSAVLVEINDTATSESRWTIKPPNFYYGENLHRFIPGVWTTPETLATTGSASLQVMYFPDFDPGVLEQPVRAIFELERAGDLAADEVLEVALPMPAHHAESAPVEATGLWSGPVSIVAADKSTISRGRGSFSGSGNSLTLLVDNFADGAKVTTVTLHNAETSVLLETAGGGTLDSVNYSRWNFPWDSDWDPSARSFQDFTTITAIIQAPHQYTRRFEFTVQPNEATVISNQ